MKSGNQRRGTKGRKKTQFTERDRSVLRHVGTFGLTWNEVIHKKFFAGKGVDAVKSMIRRLTTEGRPCVLKSDSLDQNRVYYQLTLPGTRLIGVSADLARSIKLQSKIRRYAIQSFVCLSEDAKRTYVTNSEIADKFEIRVQSMPQGNFYRVEHSDSTRRMGYAVVDYGSDVRRLRGRLLSRASSLGGLTWLKGLIASSAVELTALVVSQGKACSLRSSLKKYTENENGKLRLTTDDGISIPFDIVVIDKLSNLIPDPRMR